MQSAGPTFLGIGAQKAGTTWLYSQLQKHSQIWLPPHKELHFFDRALKYPSSNGLLTSSLISRITGGEPWERKRTIVGLKVISESAIHLDFDNVFWWSKFFFGFYDLNWYKSLFSPAVNYKAAGDITPSYSILDREDVAQIKKFNPDIKLIFMIRNPIDRAWSSIRHNKVRGKDIDLSASKRVIRSLKAPAKVLKGDYERTLNHYLEYFDSSQILVCFYDAIQNDAVTLMSSITEFLGVDNFDAASINNKVYVNKSLQRPMPDEVRNFLCETYGAQIDRFAMRFGSYAKSWKNSLKSQDAILDSQSEGERFIPAFHP